MRRKKDICGFKMFTKSNFVIFYVILEVGYTPDDFKSDFRPDMPL